jgi:hypothetical protein
MFRLAVLAAVIAGAAYGGAFALPDNARAERHVSIAAAPSAVAAQIASLRNYPNWLAWTEVAPGITYSFSGPESGTGQQMSWNSASPLLNNGSAQAVAANEAEIEIRLDGGVFRQAVMYLKLAPVEGGTGVTWTITMPNDDIEERWQRYFTFESKVSPFMVKSLANLKNLLEQSS